MKNYKCDKCGGTFTDYRDNPACRCGGTAKEVKEDEGKKMAKKVCKYKPCHKTKNMDCAFCYCPVYPCKIKDTGGKLVKDVWDCSDCTIVHNKEFVDLIKEFFLIEVFKRLI